LGFSSISLGVVADLFTLQQLAAPDFALDHKRVSISFLRVYRSAGFCRLFSVDRSPDTNPPNSVGNEVSRPQTQVRPTPRFLAPPRRANPSPRNEVIDPAQAARMRGLRTVLTSGADEVMAKPAPNPNVTVSFPTRVASPAMLK
jgi:hypothetical protein